MFNCGNKLYSFWALLFVVLTVFGFQIATSLFLPLASDDNAISRTVTYPYRAVMLLLALLLIVFTPNKKKTINSKKVANTFFIFFIIYFLRIIVDIFFRKVYVDPDWRQTTIQYILLSVLPSMWATMRCAQYIDYDRLNKWLIWFSLAMLIILIFNQSSLLQAEFNEMSRMNANVAMGSISLGHMGCTIFYISFVWVLVYKHKFVRKSILVVMMGISFIIMLRAASRSPLIAFMVMFLLILYSRFKNKNLAVFFSIIAILVVWLNIDAIIHYIGQISPVMEQRMSDATYEGDTSDRDILFLKAIDVFLRDPILGEKFVLDNGFYSHNSLLDVLMALGIFGGLVWLYLMIKDVLVTSRLLSSHSSIMIIGLLSVQKIIMHLFSGTIYTSNEIVVLMAIVLLFQKPMASEKDNTFGSIKRSL